MVGLKKNFVYQSVYQILEMLLPLVTSPLLSRALGAEGLGIYSYLSAVVGYFVLFANMGMYKYGIREIAKVQQDSGERSRVFWEIWIFHSLLSAVFGGLYIAYMVFFSEYRMYCLIMFLSYAGGVMNINWLFFGMEDFRKITISNIIMKLASFVLILCFVKCEGDLVRYFWIMAASSLVSYLVYWPMCWGYLSRKKVSVPGIFSHWKGMLFLFVPVLLETIYSNMDILMLGLMDTKEEVGYYSNAVKALITKTLIFSLTTVLMPRMAHLLAKEDRRRYDDLMRKSTSITILLASAFGFGTAAVAKEFSVLFWGEGFRACAGLIMVMAFAIPGIVLSRVVREQYLIPAGRDREYLLSALAGTIANLLINCLLIPGYGAMGAAIATLISEYIVLMVQIVSVRKEFCFLKYVHGNEIYAGFGFVMFWTVRLVGEWLGIHIYTLCIEIMAGAGIFLLLCCIYWRISHEQYYLELLKHMVKRKS